MKKWRKAIFYLFGFLLLLGAGITLFLNINPAFGDKLTKEQKGKYKQFNNYVNGKFINELPASTEINLTDYNSYTSVKDRRPNGQIPVSAIDWNIIKSEKDSLTWFGHSAFLLNISQKKLLFDPMLGPIASPVSFVGIKKYKYRQDMLQIIDEIPLVDAVFISHDHYDHLDYQSIIKLKNKVAHFFVPLGVSAHLIRWGVQKEKITELNWWDEIEYQGLTIALTPTRHFSGREPFNFSSTLWGGWIILGEKTRLYFSGDSGYGPHFKEIGKKYRPLNLALIDGAQYDRRWADMHMTPEQSVQANLDLDSQNMMLIHWGAFTLARHGWKEPIERALKKAEKDGVNLIAPKIGETVLLNSDLHIPFLTWWDY